MKGFIAWFYAVIYMKLIDLCEKYTLVRYMLHITGLFFILLGFYLITLGYGEIFFGIILSYLGVIIFITPFGANK